MLTISYIYWGSKYFTGSPIISMSSIWNISFGAKYFEVFVQGGTILGGSNFVFRVRFLYGFMFVYICQDDGAVGFVDFTTLLFALYSLAQPFNRVRSIPEHVFVILNRRKTCAGCFREETTGKRTGPIAKWPPWRFLITRLEIVLGTISFAIVAVSCMRPYVL